jgi:hypothetical protein
VFRKETKAEYLSVNLLMICLASCVYRDSKSNFYKNLILFCPLYCEQAVRLEAWLAVNTDLATNGAMKRSKSNKVTSLLWLKRHCFV